MNRLNILSVLNEFARETLNNKSLRALTDEQGDVILTNEDLGKLSHDLGVFLSRAIERIVEVETDELGSS